jgi:hypothetical protein
MMHASMRRWLMAIACASLSACGGGGGGGGDNNGGGGPTLSGLMPAAPALGKTLAEDAASLRPMREGASWRYRGSYTKYLGATPETYETTTTQSQVSANGATEDHSDDGHQGAASYAVNISGGEVSSPVFITFTSNSPGENIKAIELRSPVRVGDQIPLWDRHFADVGVDVDGDSKPDALDTAAYVRVIGEETVLLDDLPPQRAVRVDVTQLARVTPSSTGQPGVVLTGLQQTWYVAGMGIVRQLTRLPSDVSGDTVTDERLISWDGLDQGLGALPRQSLTIPQDNAVYPGQPLTGQFDIRAFPTRSGALLLSSSPTDRLMLASTLDTRGRVTGSVELPASVNFSGQWAFADERLVWISEQGRDAVAMSVFDERGVAIGAVPGHTLDLRGGHLAVQVFRPTVALDGGTLWLLFHRSYYDPAPGASPSSETVLRAYNLGGQPLSPEMIVDGPQSQGVHSLSAAQGHVLVAWERTVSGGKVWRYAQPTRAGLGTVRTLTAAYTSNSTWLESVSLQDHDLFHWNGFPGLESTTGEGAALLGPNGTPRRAGNSWVTENLADFATGDAPSLSSAGNRLVFWRREPLPVDGAQQAVVRWIDVDGTALAAAPMTRIAGGTSDPLRAAVVLADRVLLISGNYQMSSQVVWLNRGAVP